MSDSDGDDTTPLLNPVDHTNHGTFAQSDGDAANPNLANLGRRKFAKCFV